MVKATPASKRRSGTGKRTSGAVKGPKKSASPKPKLSPRLSGGALQGPIASAVGHTTPEQFAQLRDGRRHVIIFAASYAKAQDWARKHHVERRDWYFLKEPSDICDMRPADMIIVQLPGWYMSREYRTQADDLVWETYKALVQAFQVYRIERVYHQFGDAELCLGKKT